MSLIKIKKFINDHFTHYVVMNGPIEGAVISQGYYEFYVGYIGIENVELTIEDNRNYLKDRPMFRKKWENLK